MVRRIFGVCSLAAVAPLAACGGMIKTGPEDASLPVDAATESAVVPIADAGAAPEASPFDASALDPKVFGKCINESYMFWIDFDGDFDPLVGPQSLDGTKGTWTGVVNSDHWVKVNAAGDAWVLQATSDINEQLKPGTYTLSAKTSPPSLVLVVAGRACVQAPYEGSFTVVELASKPVYGEAPLTRMLIGWDTKCGTATVRGCMSFGR